MSIIIKNQLGEFCFSLDNFIKKGSEHIYIEYDFHLKMDDFESNQLLQAEIFDLQDLLKGFKFFQEKLSGTFYFEPIISSQIKIKFEMTKQGHIAIDGYVTNKLHNIKLSFKFGTDQTFLSDLILQCSNTINFLSS